MPDKKKKIETQTVNPVGVSVKGWQETTIDMFRERLEKFYMADQIDGLVKKFLDGKPKIFCISGYQYRLA